MKKLVKSYPVKMNEILAKPKNKYFLNKIEFGIFPTMKEFEKNGLL
jgi:hypothetical protein